MLDRNTITRQNALEVLADTACPACQAVGNFQLFDEIANGGVGVQCVACGKHHPFVKQHVMWLRGEDKRRSNDVAAVAREAGAYCYSCGLTFEELLRLGIRPVVHHSRPFAAHGEVSRKIPVCGRCHELMNFMQRIHQQLLKRQ